MIFVYTNNNDFYKMISPLLQNKSKQIINYDVLQKNIKNADMIIFDGEQRENGAQSFIKESNLLGINMPPTIVIIEKKEDKWLSDWAGATIVIQKPINTFELMNVINQYL